MASNLLTGTVRFGQAPRMRFAAPPLSDLRLRRLHRWALLWLKWIAAFLDAAEAFAAAYSAAPHPSVLINIGLIVKPTSEPNAT